MTLEVIADDTLIGWMAIPSILEWARDIRPGGSVKFLCPAGERVRGNDGRLIPRFGILELAITEWANAGAQPRIVFNADGVDSERLRRVHEFTERPVVWRLPPPTERRMTDRMRAMEADIDRALGIPPDLFADDVDPRDLL